MNRAYADFHGREPRGEFRVRLPRIREPWALGEAVEVVYRRPGERVPYRHVFKRGGRPLLVSDASGRWLLIVAGGFRVTPNGIVG